MSRKIALTYTKKLIDFFQSERKFENCDMSIPQFSVMKNKNGADINLVIGYTNDNKYVVIKSHGVRDSVLDAHPISKEGMENPDYYVRVPRKLLSTTERGIFDVLLQTGDRVMCVAKGRYRGVSFGETKTIIEISDEGRLKFDKFATYSYDPKHFVIINRRPGSLLDDSGITSVADCSTTRTLVLGTPGEVDDTPLIRRKRLEKDIQRIKPIYDPEKISRIK